ncbi:MAG: hypothetical protein IJS10_03920 [Alphaproteobacteria bacterium]|nr:hypothetical protein [Alphaproteobacteria bacterium]
METGDLLAYRKLSNRIKRKFKINIFCSDGNAAYKKIKSSNKHVINKSEACLIENTNSVIRRRLARFHRRTRCFCCLMRSFFIR